jgi:cytoskeleton protein RodZ
MKTRTIGEILQAEREYHQMGLSEMAQRTRIRQEYLQALEDNQFDQLPAATFVKGYIKTYGKLFGFDYKPLLAMLRRDYKESDRGRLVPRDFIKPVLRRRNLWTPVTIVIIVLAGVFFSLAGYVGFQWYQLQRPPTLEISQPESNQVVGPQVIVSGQTDPEALVTVNAEPVSLQPDGEFETQVFMPREGLNTITIEAEDGQGKTNLQQRTVRVEF